MKSVYKHSGKAVFFVVLALIAALCYIVLEGIPLPNQGDTQKWLFKGVMSDGLSLGIDIRGGVDVTFRPNLSKGQAITNTIVKQTADVLNTRLDGLKITDRTVQPNYTKGYVVVRFPWPKGTTSYNAEDAIKALGATNKLTFKDASGKELMSGADVASASVHPVETGSSLSGNYYIELALNKDGQKKWPAATKANIGKTISINLDSTTLSSPTVKEEIDSATCTIDGFGTAAEASKVASRINQGALPFTLVTDNYQSISPTLGADALNVMVLAGIIAFILICLFMILYYRVPGFIAVLCLCGHFAGMLLSLLLFSYTLTLPGIAGLILSLGMGVDCNIITAERIKEELREGRTLDGAIDQGFDMSFTAIFDGNITVIIAGVILLIFGSASVKSFGFTLVAGVVFNFLMGIIASRYMLKSSSKYPFMRKGFLYGGANAK